jgi:hypothetical protein
MLGNSGLYSHSVRTQARYRQEIPLFRNPGSGLVTFKYRQLPRYPPAKTDATIPKIPIMLTTVTANATKKSVEKLFLVAPRRWVVRPRMGTVRVALAAYDFRCLFDMLMPLWLPLCWRIPLRLRPIYALLGWCDRLCRFRKYKPKGCHFQSTSLKFYQQAEIMLAKSISYTFWGVFMHNYGS